METTDERDARYERNHERAKSEVPNQTDRQCNKIVLSVVSNEAERSNKQRQDRPTCCFAITGSPAGLSRVNGAKRCSAGLDIMRYFQNGLTRSVVNRAS